MKFLLVIFILFEVSGFRNIYPAIRTLASVGEDAGEPLFVTSLIESGQIGRARQLTEVQGLLEGVRSYSGYLTVNKGYDSNMFFWFFPAERSPENAPVLLWLNGGPGESSLYGLFIENGVFRLTDVGVLQRREHYWSQVFNVIYMDNPVGSGYSFTGSDEGYAKDQVRVGEELYSALLQFFQLFPELQKNDFFITGESYAGKYIPAAAHAIHKYNKESPHIINLQGLAIGDGFCDPENQIAYGEYLYQIGLIDDNARQLFNEKEQEIIRKIRAGKFIEAYDLLDTLIDGGDAIYGSIFYNETGFNIYHNFLYDDGYGDSEPMDDFVQKAEVRKLIHVGNLTFHSVDEVDAHLKSDEVQSVKPWIEELLEHYRVLFYNGQLDIIVAYALTVNFLRTLNWSGADLYKTAPRKQWYVGTDLAGYTKTAKGMTEVMVRNAGHMVPADQPLWALDLISRFVYNEPF